MTGLGPSIIISRIDFGRVHARRGMSVSLPCPSSVLVKLSQISRQPCHCNIVRREQALIPLRAMGILTLVCIIPLSNLGYQALIFPALLGIGKSIAQCRRAMDGCLIFLVVGNSHGSLLIASQSIASISGRSGLRPRRL
ncbi:hypothetical protein BOSEA31B_13868 [Hyphomicrobiales bacterium]|nr:hypothetical protein BOSEA31B_13868 [Hyphomicrobiales bacterium]